MPASTSRSSPSSSSNKHIGGAPEKDATVIRLWRELFRDHNVSSEWWAKTVEDRPIGWT